MKPSHILHGCAGANLLEVLKALPVMALVVCEYGLNVTLGRDKGVTAEQPFGVGAPLG